jgi:hypothetical protein
MSADGKGGRALEHERSRKATTAVALLDERGKLIGIYPDLGAARRVAKERGFEILGASPAVKSEAPKREAYDPTAPPRKKHRWAYVRSELPNEALQRCLDCGAETSRLFTPGKVAPEVCSAWLKSDGAKQPPPRPAPTPSPPPSIYQPSTPRGERRRA